MSLAHPDYFLWLIVLFLFLCTYVIQTRIREKKKREWLGSQGHFLISSISQKNRHIKFSLKIGVLACMVLALVRLQSPGERVEIQNKGVYILLLVDLSTSMLAEDVKPNRLIFMKKELENLMDKSPGDQIALGVFARSALLITPFTRDRDVIKSYLKYLSPDYLSNQGTDFKRAFQMSVDTFSKIKKSKNKAFVKAVVIASDGGEPTREAKKAIKNLITENKVRVFALAFGTREGAVIPIKDYKNQVKEYKKDTEGRLVITRLMGQSLKNFAKWGKGSYYHVTYGGKAIENLREDLNHLEKSLMDTKMEIQKKEHYQWFLILALFLAFLELLFGERLYKKKIREVS